MGISTERIPKSASRVLDAAKIRAEYKQKKRARIQMEGGVADANDFDKPWPNGRRIEATTTQETRRTNAESGCREEQGIDDEGEGEGASGYRDSTRGIAQTFQSVKRPLSFFFLA